MNRQPDFLVIGAPKAGTTWCHDFLHVNEQFFVPAAKDTYFFDRHFERGEPWYERHFRPADHGQIVGEVCHDYMYSRDALGRIREYFSSGVRTVLVLREPVARSLSHLKYSHQLGNVDSLDQSALETNPNIIELSRYEQYLDAVVELLGRDLSILFFEDLTRDSSAFGTDLATACGMPLREEDIVLPGRSNPSGKARSRVLAKSAKSAAQLLDRAGARTLVGGLKSSPIRGLLFDTSTSQDIDEVTRQTIDDALRRSRSRTIEWLDRSPHRVNPIPEAWYR